MCEPTTLAIAMAGSQVLGMYGQQQQGKAQRSALNDQNAVHQEELRDQASEKIGERAKLARRERARAAVAAAEGGVGGQSFALQIKQSMFDQSQDAANINKNLSTASRGANAQTRSQIAQTPSPGALDFVSAGLGGYGSGLQIGNQIKSARGK